MHAGRVAPIGEWHAPRERTPGATHDTASPAPRTHSARHPAHRPRTHHDAHHAPRSRAHTHTSTRTPAARATHAHTSAHAPRAPGHARTSTREHTGATPSPHPRLTRPQAFCISRCAWVWGVYALSGEGCAHEARELPAAARAEGFHLPTWRFPMAVLSCSARVVLIAPHHEAGVAATRRHPEYSHAMVVVASDPGALRRIKGRVFAGWVLLPGAEHRASPRRISELIEYARSHECGCVQHAIQAVA